MQIKLAFQKYVPVFEKFNIYKSFHGIFYAPNLSYLESLF